MIVLDASAAVELVLGTSAGGRVKDRLREGGEIHAPHVVDIEVVHAVRGLILRGQTDATKALAAIRRLQHLPMRRQPHRPLLRRVWDLRDNLTAYDACYVALAEALDAPLLTRDARLASAPGHRARIEVV